MKETILITSNAYFPNIGGVENSLRYLAQSYKKLGFNVIVAVSNIASDGSQLPDKEVIDGITIYRYPTYASSKGLGKYFRAVRSAFAAWKLLVKLKESNNIVLTLSRFHTATLIACLAKLSSVVYLVPGVVKYQNNSANLVSRSGSGKLKLYLSRFLHHNIQLNALKHCNQVLVFSRNMEKQIDSILPQLSSLPILKPGVDTQRFMPVLDKNNLRQAHSIPENKTILLTVGRFVRAKGFDLVIDAMQALPNCYLVMVGDGENMAESRQQIDNNRLNDRILLVGSTSDTAPYYQLADVFIMSSRYEPLGQTILEALSCGLPIVAFEGGDVTTATREMLAQDEAQFTDDISAEGLVKSINQLIANPELIRQLSQTSRELALNKFSWDTLAQQTLAYKKNEPGNS